MADRKIPMVDLYAQYLSIKSEVDKVVKTVIKESAFVGGRFVEQFEVEFAQYCQARYAVALNSGTDALYLSLWVLGIKSGDEVITTPFTFFATAEAILRFGAKPVFVDIEPDTFNLDTNIIQNKITQKTKAIIPVHLFGRPTGMEKIRDLAKKYELAVVEDACQAIGAKFNGKMVGNIGDIGCFSFFPSKNLGAYGDGGAIITNNKELADQIRKLRNHGSMVKYQNESIGVSSRLDGLQAAILSAKLPHLNKWNELRRLIAKEYTKLLTNVEKIITPLGDDDKIYSVYHQYTIRVKEERDGVKKYLMDNKISSAIYYPIPLHLLPAMRDLGYKAGNLPVAEKVSNEALSLPIYPELGLSEIAEITGLIKNYNFGGLTR